MTKSWLLAHHVRQLTTSFNSSSEGSDISGLSDAHTQTHMHTNSKRNPQNLNDTCLQYNELHCIPPFKIHKCS